MKKNDNHLIIHFIKNLEKKFPFILNKMQSTLIPLKKIIFDKKKQELIFIEMLQEDNTNKPGIYIFFDDSNIEFIGHSLFNCNKRVKLQLNNKIQNGQKFFRNKQKSTDRSIFFLTKKDRLDDNLLITIESFLIKKIRPTNNVLLNQYLK